MSKISFQKIWNNHPYPDSPCDTATFPNQCAIRMGVALRETGVDMSTFRGARCYPGFKHNPKHILRAQELADWLKTQNTVVGDVKVYRNVTSGHFGGRKGIVFIKNGWGPTDHIDVWNGSTGEMKGGNPSYFSRGQEVWFWELA